jgi:hypothetical protein
MLVLLALRLAVHVELPVLRRRLRRHDGHLLLTRPSCSSPVRRAPGGSLPVRGSSGVLVAHPATARPVAAAPSLVGRPRRSSGVLVARRALNEAASRRGWPTEAPGPAL